jgi:glyoxylase-like metal-dependent hydrolase (beta-lactamase superfamily II)
MTASDRYQVSIVKFGTRSTVKSDVYLNFHIYKMDDEPVEMDYFFWVIRNAQRTVVVDTGFSKHGGEVRNRTFLIEPAAAFAALGVAPAEAPQVLVTHGHYDHIGNLDLFPESNIIMARAELDFWLSSFAARKQFRHSVEEEELDYLKRAAGEGRIKTFDHEHSIAPGIRMFRVGGHTPGQSIVTVDTSDGQVVLASDAIHYYEEYEQDLPFMFVNDVREMYAGFDTIRQLMETTASHLVTCLFIHI